MAITVFFYNFAKKINSTARPTGGASYSCLLKSPCSTTNPRIELQISGDPSAYNMAYIPDFERYYFVDEWVYDESVWTANMTVDALATYKPLIGQSTQYILRAENGDGNGDISDSIYPTLAPVVTDTKVLTSYDYINNGMFIIGVAGPAGVSPTTYYRLSGTQLADLASSMWAGFQTLLGLSPMSFITSFKWYPFPFSIGTAATFKLGPISTSYDGYRLDRSELVATMNSHYDIPNHSQIDRGNYLNYPPYRNVRISGYPFGDFGIYTPSIYENSRLNSQLKVDFTTGMGLLRIYGPSGYSNDAVTVESKIGSDISISGNSIDIKAAVATIAGVAVSASGDISNAYISASKNIAKSTTLKTAEARARHSAIAEGIVSKGILKAEGRSALGVLDAASAITSRPGYTQSGGSMATEGLNVSAVCYETQIADESKSTYGRPLYEEKTISSIPGYIVCGNAKISINGTDDEIASVKSFMDSGFYFE